MKVSPRLPLASLRVFEAVARCGSMARAAEALNVLPSAVSMQIKRLSTYVGVPLVAMNGRRLELTPQGERLLPAVMVGLTEIHDAITALRDDIAGRPFVLTVLPSFLHLWLMPRLAAFESTHPSFHMQILSDPHIVDRAGDNVDAAIRLGAGRWPGVKATKLMGEWLVPVCTPGLHKQVGRLKRGELPSGVRLIHSVEPWSRWTGGPGPHLPRTITICDAMAALAETERGKGVALMPWSLCDLAFKAGRLAAVGEKMPLGSDYYWAVQGRRTADTRGDTLFKWLKEQAAAA